jgi:hypothetical protein
MPNNVKLVFIWNTLNESISLIYLWKKGRGGRGGLGLIVASYGWASYFGLRLY